MRLPWSNVWCACLRLAASGWIAVLRSIAESQQGRKSNEKSTQTQSKIEGKSTKNRSWALLGDPGRCGDAPGGRRNAPGTRQSAPGTAKSALGVAPGRPRALQERSGHPQNAFSKFPGRQRKRSRCQAWTEALVDRNSNVFGSTRGSPDMRFVPLLPLFC